MEDIKMVVAGGEKENQQNKRKSLVKRSLAAILLGVAVIGTFHTTDNEKLKKENKSELITIVYNQKGSSAGIVTGAVNRVYGNINGGSVGLVNYFKGNVNGLAFSILNFSDSYSKITGAAISIFGNGIGGELNGLELAILTNNTGFMLGDQGKSKTRVSNGVQASLWNVAGNLKNAIQIGLVNFAEKTEKTYLQIGVFNQTNERKTVGINFGYKK